MGYEQSAARIQDTHWRCCEGYSHAAGDFRHPIYDVGTEVNAPEEVRGEKVC
jgi:hypothetical protein